MKKVLFKNLKYIPASHEDPKDPGAVKKILFDKNDFPKFGKIQMINRALIKKGRSFKSHLHEDMDEVFLILTGKVLVKIGNEKTILNDGDGLIVPKQTYHEMENIGKEDTDYIVMGIAQGKSGKTIVSKT